jgi:anti-sigma B factor antagonist
MKIETDHRPGNRAVVRLIGQADADSASTLKATLKQAAAEGAKRVVVDLEKVDFIDSSGLSALVSGLKLLREKGGTLSLSRPRPQAMTALRLTMLDRVFAISSSIEEALQVMDTADL